MGVYDVSKDLMTPNSASLNFYDTNTFVWVEVWATICMEFCMGIKTNPP